ncbi:MAG: recombinase family protein [Bacilli bacterium]
MNNKLKVGIYLRLSNEDKDKINKEDNSESIKNQRNMLIDYINKHPQIELTDEYCDEDLSGAGTYRPEFERLIKDCENKKLNIVLCKSQSRFSRDMEVVEKYLNNKFLQWQIRFISLSDSADTENEGNKKSRQINGLVNEWYLEDVSNNIRSSFNSKMKEGEFISPFSPYGYEISKENNNKLIVDPIASIIVKKIYNLYISGLGFTSIAVYLNNESIPCPSLYKYQKKVKLNIISNKERKDIKWSSTAIKNILTNEVYLGHLIQGKRTTINYKNHKVIKKDPSKWIRKENTHEAIITSEIFSKVKLIINQKNKTLKTTGTTHIFSSKVFCLECKERMKKKNSSTHEYLVCSNYNNGCNNCINKTSIRYDTLKSIILNEINIIIKKYYNTSFIINEVSTHNDTQSINKIKQLNNQKNKIKQQIIINRNSFFLLYKDKTNKIINDKQFKELLINCELELNNLNNELKLINNEIKLINKKNNKLKSFNDSYVLKTLNKFIIDEFIKSIYIGKSNIENGIRNILIVWK